ncbi:unnamed protein product [Absidia cylindrospora]
MTNVTNLIAVYALNLADKRVLASLYCGHVSMKIVSQGVLPPVLPVHYVKKISTSKNFPLFDSTWTTRRQVHPTIVKHQRINTKN